MNINSDFQTENCKENMFLPGLVPIVLGVTGHRDIPKEDVAKLSLATLEILRNITELTPNSPHILISCLAEGADRIAAHCALDFGWALGVVLPSSIESYELDFNSTQSKDEFRTLIKAASWVETAPSEHLQKPDYLAAGIRMMQQSQLLIAYWNGMSTGLQGGTSDLVEKFKSEIPVSGDRLLGNSPPDARPVVHVMTRRGGENTELMLDTVGKIEWLPPQPCGMNGTGELERWREVLRRIDLFNSDATSFCQKHSHLVHLSRGYLELETDLERRNEFQGEEVSACMFALADAMSAQAQNERTHVFYKVSGLALAAVVLEQTYSGLFSSPFVLCCSVLCGIFATLIFRDGTRRRIEARYLDYRSLAEACRVQYYWMKCGIRASVENNFLMEQRDELEWIRRAITTNELSVNVALFKLPNEMNCFDLVKRSWIEEQCHYFVGCSERNGGNKADLNYRKSQAWSTRASTVFMVGVFVVVALVISRSYLIGHWPDDGALIAQFAGVTYGVLFALAGLMKVYQEVSAFSEHSRSYRRSGLLMRRASQRLAFAINSSDIEYAQRVIYAAGCEALDENGDWLLLHRDRPVQVPLG